MIDIRKAKVGDKVVLELEILREIDLDPFADYYSSVSVENPEYQRKAAGRRACPLTIYAENIKEIIPAPFSIKVGDKFINSSKSIFEIVALYDEDDSWCTYKFKQNNKVLYGSSLSEIFNNPNYIKI